MNIHETVFKITESANELCSQGDYVEAILLIQMIDRLCKSHKIDMLYEAISLNIALDAKFNIDIFAYEGVPTFVKNIIENKVDV